MLFRSMATAPDTSAQAENFVRQMLPHAREAEQATGVPARFVLAQAALESGWGRSEVRGADGSASMTFTGTLTDINNALDGLEFNPTLNFNGTASVEIITDDQGNTGSGGPLTDDDTVAITVNAVDDAPDRKSTRLNSSHMSESRMPSSA